VRTVRGVAVLSGFGQVALLGLLAGATGLSFAGWLVGVAYGATANALFFTGLRRSGATAVGAANKVTLVRSALVGGVAALVASGFGGTTALPVILALAAIALALDGFDGWVARRTASVSAIGARFDGEVDAFLILVLSVHVARSIGWALAIGLMRYVFLAAGVLPWMRAGLPPRYWRKVVAATQGVVLAVAASGLLTRASAEVALAVALLLLSESFGRDVWWLATHRPRAITETPASRLRRAARAAATGGAVLLFWGALVAPDRPATLTVSTFLRVPIEGLVVVGVALLLPSRPRALLAALLGVILGALTVVRVLDISFFAVVDRPFNPVTDWGSFGPAIGVLRDSVGRAWTDILEIVAIAGIAMALVTMTLATVRVSRTAARHPKAAVGAISSLGLVATLCAAFGISTSTGATVASASSAGLVSAQVDRIRTGVDDQHTFDTQLAQADRFALTPGNQLLTALRGKDVLLVFVESYGRVAVQDSTFSPQVDAVLTNGTKTLSAAGFSSRSAFLTSPTFGGVSWLAHSTLQSGLWIDNPQRYNQITASKRLTLSVAFKRAGWRTVTDIPSSKSPWPQGQHLYQFDTMYGTDDVGYRGPSFSYAKIPDQYTLEAFYQRELEPAKRRPVMAEIDLVSSHTPWAPLPQMVPWQDLGDGAIYNPMPAQGQNPSVVWREASQVRAAYGQSIQYSLNALISFIQRIHDDNLVVVMLGDHQPATVVTGDNASHDVPITIIAHDPNVFDRISSWGWQRGMLPDPQAPVWRMDTFRDRFLTAFGPQRSQSEPPR
jgi:phosphatidylglycerophosphate synthase